MKISWYGQSCFKIETEKAKIICDPYSESIGLQLPPLTADIVTVSHQHSDHNNTKVVSGIAQKRPVIFSGPGEYEAMGINFEGIPSFHDSKSGAERGLNTIFKISADNLKICHLGDLGHILTNLELEKIAEIDILLVPVGGVFTIDAEQASEVISQIDPKIVMPMHYQIKDLSVGLDPLEKFAKVEGVKDFQAKESFNAIEKNLPTEEREIVILRALKK